MDTSTTTVAAGMVSSPAWLPWLYGASEFAALIAPILGAVWLTVQIVTRLQGALRKDKTK